MASTFQAWGNRFNLPGVWAESMSLLASGNMNIAFREWATPAGMAATSGATDAKIGAISFDPFGSAIPGTTRYPSTATSFWSTTSADRASVTDLKTLALSNGSVLFSWQQAADAFDQQPQIRSMVYNPVNGGVWGPVASGTQILGTAAGFDISNYGGFDIAQTTGGLIINVATRAATDFATNGRDLQYLVLSEGASGFTSAATVNTTLAGDQTDPDIAALTGGGFVIAWSDMASTTGDVRMRLYGSSASATTGELAVNTTTAGVQQNASISALGNGGFVVAWQENAATDANEPGNWGIRVQRFDSTGAKQGAETHVNTRFAGDQGNPEVRGFRDGSYLVAWLDQLSGTDYVVKGQYFDAADARVGTEFTIGTTAAADASIRIQESNDGRVLVTWDSPAGAQTPGLEAPVATNGQFLDNRPVQITGTAGNDLILGRDTGMANVHDILVGAAGNDQLYGLGGNDYFYGGAGDDVMVGAAGIDVILGEDGNDTEYGGDDTDYLFGGAGSNALFGEGGVDVLNSTGTDVLYGGAGGDYFYTDSTATVTAFGEADNDLFVFSSAGNVSGDDGQDYFYMSAAKDIMLGGAGVDVLMGGGGQDIYDGGAGVDYHFLGSGTDTVRMNLTSGVDVVNNFTVGTDKIQLQQTGMLTFAQVKAAMTDYGSFTVITIDANTAIWLIGVSPNQLTAWDFLFNW